MRPSQIDGRLLRTGAANFSASGLKRENNDFIVIESAEAAAAFKRLTRTGARHNEGSSLNCSKLVVACAEPLIRPDTPDQGRPS